MAFWLALRSSIPLTCRDPRLQPTHTTCNHSTANIVNVDSLCLSSRLLLPMSPSYKKNSINTHFPTTCIFSRALSLFLSNTFILPVLSCPDQVIMRFCWNLKKNCQSLFDFSWRIGLQPGMWNASTMPKWRAMSSYDQGGPDRLSVQLHGWLPGTRLSAR